MTNQKVGYLLLIPSIVLGLFLFNINTRIVLSAASHVVISEVLVGSTGAGENEFIEIYNPMETPVDISGWVVSRKTASADIASQSALAAIPASTQLKGHGFYLIAHESYTGTASADLKYADNSIASNNTIYLKNNGGTLVDKLGFGTTNDAENTAKGNPSTGASAERKANATSTATTLATGIDMLMGNGEDSDNNSADFVNRTNPEPQNSLSTAEPTLTTPTPSATSSATPTVSPTASASASASPASTPSATPTSTPTPTATASATPTASPTMSPTPTPIPTASPTASPTTNPSAIPSPSATPTPSATPRIFAQFDFGNHTRVCTISYKTKKILSFTIRIPNLECFTIKND